MSPGIPAPAHLADDILAADFGPSSVLEGHEAAMEESRALCAPIGEEVQEQVLALEQVGAGPFCLQREQEGRASFSGMLQRQHLCLDASLAGQPCQPDVPPPRNLAPQPPSPQLALEAEALRRQVNSLRVDLTIYRSSLAFMDSPMQV